MRSNAEEERMRRLRADRTLRIVELIFGVLGAAFIVAGFLLYVFTAPPIGGLAWDHNTLLVSAVLVLGGLVIVVMRKWEP